MPVTIKLSKHLYDTLGEQVADELVNWFNQVDATYRSDLREFNEINFSRFDAKLEQRLTEFAAGLGARIDGLDAKIDRVNGSLDARIDRVYTDLNAKINGLDAKIDHMAIQLDATLERRLAEFRADLLKWSFLFWIGTVVTIVGAMKFVR
jgi:hypothetical protein